MTLYRPPRITDVCLVTRNLEAAVEFYRDRLGFQLESSMPGFADFHPVGGVTLAVWEGSLIRAATGVPAAVEEPYGHGVMIACELESPEAIDRAADELISRGVELYGPPKDYPWNARCVYFPGPCGEFWEYFAWHEGGKPGAVHHEVTA